MRSKHYGASQIASEELLFEWPFWPFLVYRIFREESNVDDLEQNQVDKVLPTF